MSKQLDEMQTGVIRVGTDDFMQIRGVGKRNQHRLNEAGIYTFEQLAQQTPAELAALLNDAANITAERIEKQDWTGQARRLAAARTALDKETLEFAGESQHYATFTAELLLGENNLVRRTRMIHVQTQTEEAWAGWQSGRLEQFIVEHADIAPKMRAPELSSVEPTKVEPQPGPRAVTDLPLVLSAMDIGPLDQALTDETQEIIRRAYSEIEFTVHRDKLTGVAQTATPVWVNIFACNLNTAQAFSLAEKRIELEPARHHYSTRLEFDLPSPGKYWVLGSVILPEANVSYTTQGLFLTLVP